MNGDQRPGCFEVDVDGPRHFHGIFDLETVHDELAEAPRSDVELFAGELLGRERVEDGEAVGELEGSKAARAAFGDRVVDHYLHAARLEQRAFDQAVTDWELIRGFERL